MKAKDLMIGDWVNYHDDDKIVPKQVSEITDFKQLQLHDKDNWIIVGEKYCEPIPLTAEILEKNGFDMDDYIVHFKEDNHYMLEMVFEDDELKWTINCNEYTIMNFEYVHELQHALRLCGVEKEIIL